MTSPKDTAVDAQAAMAAIAGITDDYMTSEVHHPGYVLIPVAKFEQLRLAEKAFPDRYASDTAAKALYDTWSYRDGWVPWVERGNSTMQDQARRAAS